MVFVHRAQGPKFTDEQRAFIIHNYEKMMTMPAIVRAFKARYPYRGETITENSVASTIDRARKRGWLKREKYSRHVDMRVKQRCIALYNENRKQSEIIEILLSEFPKFGRVITRNMISGWVKWGREHRLLTRIASARHVAAKKGRGRATYEDPPPVRVVPITLPYVRCIDPARAAVLATLLRQPVEVYKALRR